MKAMHQRCIIKFMHAVEHRTYHRLTGTLCGFARMGRVTRRFGPVSSPVDDFKQNLFRDRSLNASAHS